MNNTVPLSKQLFNDLYNIMSDKIQKSEGTIFENVSILSEIDKNYKLFMESSYANVFYSYDDIYEKNRTIQYFIENIVLSEIYTLTYDNLIKESDDNELSFSQQIILESTQEKFNLVYRGDHQETIIEESFTNKLNIFSKGAIVTSAMFAGFWPGLFASTAVLGVQLLFPSRWARSSDHFLEKAFGLLGSSVLGTKSLLSMGNTGLSNSNRNIINFDNVHVNPEVKKLFNTLSRTQDKKAPIQGINTIVASCLENNDPLNAIDTDAEHKRGYFRGVYSPKNNSVFTVFIESLFKSSSSKNDKSYGTLINYRKCLSEKLVDMYKFLMIANISQSTEYKKILRVMKHGFHDNPEQLLTFIGEDTETEKINKENIITLIKFRLFLIEMTDDLKKGSFDVDKEAGTFLNQHLLKVDNEIEEYIQNNVRIIDTVHENREEFDKKDYKYNIRKESEFKRQLMAPSGKSFKS